MTQQHLEYRNRKIRDELSVIAQQYCSVALDIGFAGYDSPFFASLIIKLDPSFKCDTLVRVPLWAHLTIEDVGRRIGEMISERIKQDARMQP